MIMVIKKFSVNTQIVFAFSTLTAIIAVFAIAASLTLDRIERNVKFLTSQTVPNLTYMGDIREGVGLMQISTLRHILASGSEQKILQEKIIHDTAAAIAELFKQKEKVEFSKEGKRLYDEVTAQGDVYLELQEQLFKLSHIASPDEAKEFYDRMLRPAYDAYQEALDKLSVYIRASTHKREIDVVDVIEGMNRISLILVIAGGVIAAGMGFVISGIMQRLRENNLILKNEIERRKKIERENDSLILDLKEALDNVKQLSGLLPICASCKKIRDDQGYWKRIETYITEHSEAQFTHGICPECSKKLYPELHKKQKQ
jgi:DNA repair exonuclease SbcCD ATPase subunit